MTYKYPLELFCAGAPGSFFPLVLGLLDRLDANRPIHQTPPKVFKGQFVINLGTKNIISIPFYTLRTFRTCHHISICCSLRGCSIAEYLYFKTNCCTFVAPFLRPKGPVRCTGLQPQIWRPLELTKYKFSKQREIKKI